MSLEFVPHFKKPNIRALFQPDPGMLLIDADLSGADAQVVFAEAEEWETVERLRAGAKLHVESATAFFEEKFTSAAGDTKNKLSPKGKMYDDCKRGAHAGTYGASAKTIAAALGWTQPEAERFKKLYLKTLHPGIGAWQERVEWEMQTTRATKNRFGYRIHWFDRIDGLLPEALAFGPQSTVAIVTFLAAAQLRSRFPFVEFLIQVHDSLVFQIPLVQTAQLVQIAAALEVPVPFPGRELIIPWKLAVSEKNWGECSPWSPEGEKHEI